MSQSTDVAPRIPASKVVVSERSREAVLDVLKSGRLSGDGPYTKRAELYLAARTNAARALLTHSCTGALEMTAILSGIGSGDEVIMPSFTFPSTANAFVLRGATPVFVDVRPDTMNIDERLLEGAITERTKAIVVVHYAGVGCEMEAIMEIASRYGLEVIEDAAQCIGASYRGVPLGVIGTYGCLSFHGTKNVVAGEGGALLLPTPEHVLRAEILREKGTNRAAFFRREVAKYHWCDVGSSYVPSELQAALLWGELQEEREITRVRRAHWDHYHRNLEALETLGLIQRPVVPPHCQSNGHIYWVLLESRKIRNRISRELRDQGIGAVSHFEPLHLSPAGRRYGRAGSGLPVTEDCAGRLLRLPLYPSLMRAEAERVIDALELALAGIRRSPARRQSGFSPSSPEGRTGTAD